MKILIVGLIATFGFLTNLVAQGQTQVNYGAGLGQRTVHTVSGPVANDNAVWIGTFTSSFNVAANSNRPDLLLANWIHYGSTPITTLMPFNQAGSFSGTSTSTDPVFNNQKIYLWIFSTDLAATPATDFSNVNEYGLFSSSASTWAFPSVNDPPLSRNRSINTSEIDQPRFGSIDPTHLFLSGGFIPVPEPSALGLLSLAIPAVVLALRKRRSNQ
jgi:hypothetical protein